MNEAGRSHEGSGWSPARIARSRRGALRGALRGPGRRHAAYRAAGPDRRPATAASAPAASSPARLSHPEFADLYQKLHGPVFRLAVLLADDPASAETVVADAFVTLHRTWKAVQSDDYAWRYLVRLVLLRSRRVARRVARRSRLAGHHPATASDFRRTPLCVTGTAAGDRPAIIAAVRAVPQHQREAFVLVCLLEFSETEAAAAMCVRRSAVRRLLAEGLAVLGPALPDGS
jgi:DNA-directed RNA polymerase specialized sigma24 family protein